MHVLLSVCVEHHGQGSLGRCLHATISACLLLSCSKELSLVSGQAQHPCETLMDQRPSIAAPASSPHSLFPPSPCLLLQLGCIPQSPVALFWDVTIPLKNSLANGVLLFLLSLPFLGDHSSPHLENHPLVSKAQIIWPCQSKQLHALAVSEIPLDPDVHVWRCFPESTKL